MPLLSGNNKLLKPNVLDKPQPLSRKDKPLPNKRSNNKHKIKLFRVVDIIEMQEEDGTDQMGNSLQKKK